MREASLRIGDVEIRVTDPADSRAIVAMSAYFAELDRRFPGGFDPGDALTVGLEGMRAPAGAFLLAVASDGEVVGCGGLQTIGDAVGEIKRMWIDERARGQRLGTRMVDALEAAARELGHDVVRLDTNENLPDAIALYRRVGYRDVDRYNDNRYATHFFERRLDEDQA